MHALQFSRARQIFGGTYGFRFIFGTTNHEAQCSRHAFGQFASARHAGFTPPRRLTFVIAIATATWEPEILSLE